MARLRPSLSPAATWRAAALSSVPGTPRENIGGTSASARATSARTTKSSSKVNPLGRKRSAAMAHQLVTSLSSPSPPSESSAPSE